MKGIVKFLKSLFSNTFNITFIVITGDNNRVLLKDDDGNQG
jgi:hypothetical protein